MQASPTGCRFRATRPINSWFVIHPQSPENGVLGTERRGPEWMVGNLEKCFNLDRMVGSQV